MIRSFAAVVAVLTASSASAQEVAPANRPPIGEAPPVRDLELFSYGHDYVGLRWTQPFEGMVDGYELRVSTSGAIDEYSWDSAATAGWYYPEPNAPGAPQEWTLELAFAIDEGATYWFAVMYSGFIVEGGDMARYEVSPPSNNVVLQWDGTPPAAVSDLAPVSASSSTLRFRWSAPGDDGDEPGSASVYEFRRSAEPPEVDPEGWWERAVPVYGPPHPAPRGTPQEILVVGLEPQTACWIAMKSADERPNWSLLSNVAEGVTAAEEPGGTHEGGGGCGAGAPAIAAPAFLAPAALLLCGVLRRSLEGRRR